MDDLNGDGARVTGLDFSGSVGSGSGNEAASSTESYHNGGVEGDSFAQWYDANLAAEYQAPGDPGAAQGLVLDLSTAGAAYTINVTTAADGTLSGSVEFLDADGVPVAWGHFENVDQIIESTDPGSHFYTLDELNVLGENGPGLPPKVSLDGFLSTQPVEGGTGGSGGTMGSGSGGTQGSGSGGTMGSGSGGTEGSGSGGTQGSGSGGTKGSGSGGTQGSGSGGTMGSGSGGTEGFGSGGTMGSGSGGTKGSGSGGTKGSGSGGTMGSGSGGTQGSGSGGTKGSGSGGTMGSGSGGTSGTAGAVAAKAGLAAFTAFDEDEEPEEIELDDVMALMTQDVDETGDADGWDPVDEDEVEILL